MSRLSRPLRIGFVLFGLVLSLSHALGAAAHADTVDDYINAQMRKQHLPGLSLAVVQDGHVVKAKGYGLANLELRAPATPLTVYQLGSVSKQFTAAAILLLAQDGKIGLDDKIGKYFEGAPDAWKNIAIRHLLTHTSGLPREGIRTTDKTDRADFTSEEMLKAAMALPLQSQPGAKFSYSNLGFNLLGMIIEKASGRSYAAFLQERIFRPLGMTSTRVNDPYAIIPNRACAYRWSAGALRISDSVSPTLYAASGAIVSTVLDLAKWDAALYTDTLLTATSLQQMWTPMTLTDGKPTTYGFGWFIGAVKGHPDISHDGVINGFHSEIARFVEDKLTVIVLTNQMGGSDPVGIARGVARDYIPALKPALPKQARIDPATLPAFTGRYEFSNNNLLTLTAHRNRLSGQLPGGTADDYLPLSPTVFWQADEEVKVTFVKNAAGEVTGLRWQAGEGKERVIPRIGPLIHAIKPQPDPDPAVTTRVEAALKALMQGDKARQECPSITPGVRADFSGPVPELAGMQSLAFIAEQEITDRGIARHGAKVSRVRYYKLRADKAVRYVLVYLTADGLITDEDVVDD